MSLPWQSITITLERGSPAEILEDDRPVWREAATKYLTREHPEDAKARVKSVWLDGTWMPAWLEEGQKWPDWVRGARPSPPPLTPEVKTAPLVEADPFG